MIKNLGNKMEKKQEGIQPSSRKSSTFLEVEEKETLNTISKKQTNKQKLENQRNTIQMKE